MTGIRVFIILIFILIIFLEAFSQELSNKESVAYNPNSNIININKNAGHTSKTTDQEFILSWRKDENPDLALGTFEQDSLGMWFEPLGACSLKYVKIFQDKFEGIIVLDIWSTAYKGHFISPDSVQPNPCTIGYWVNGSWVPAHVLKIPPLADHIWGSLSDTIISSEQPQWINLCPELAESIYIGDRPFIVGIYINEQDEGSLSRWALDDNATIPYHFFRFSRGVNDTWFLSKFSLWLEAVVEYVEDTRPWISNFSHLSTQQVNKGPFAISADIVDWNPVGGPAGVQEARVFYVIDDGDTLSAPLLPQGNDTTYVGFIPELDSYDFKINYWINAADVNGNQNKTYPWIFLGRGPVQEPTLVVFGGYFETSLNFFKNYYLKVLRGEYDPAKTYPYEIWDNEKWKALPSLEVLQNVHTVLWYCGLNDNTMFLPFRSDTSFLAEFINQGGNFMLQDKEEYLIELYVNCLDTNGTLPIPEGYFYRDYLGVVLPDFENQENLLMTGISGNELSGDPVFQNMRLDTINMRGIDEVYPLEITDEAEVIFMGQEDRPLGVLIDGPQSGAGKTVYVATHLTYCTPTQTGYYWPDQHDQFLLNVLEWFDTPTSVENEKHGNSIPKDFTLFQNHPNPFNPDTEFRFYIPEAAHVKLEIYNLLGQRVRVLAIRQIPAGSHSIRWDGKDDFGAAVSSGVYLYRISAGGFWDVKKMVLMR